MLSVGAGWGSLKLEPVIFGRGEGANCEDGLLSASVGIDSI